MTTHVFIVDETTFPLHLQYLFAGTGAKDKDVDFNNSATSALYPNKKHMSEAGLVAMMADCCRIREGDYILFYLQATSAQEGKFYGIFQADGDAFLDRKNGQFLSAELCKNLTFRIRLQPYQVYEEGVTEWKALDEIRNISSPCQMLWSLIYRKLKGNRGNTMITVYESERLMDLIRRENNYASLPVSSGYNYCNGRILPANHLPYRGRMVALNILPRLTEKYTHKLAHETHLQMFITQNVGRNSNIDNALGLTGSNIEWIGNEVSCGVGMQRIDVMLSIAESETQRIIMPIELKSVPASVDNIRQINRYIDWIEQYYTPNRPSTICPVLLCKSDVASLPLQVKQTFSEFNEHASGRYLPLIYVEYYISGNSIIFNRVTY